MKRLEEGSLELLPQTDAAGLRSGGRWDIDDNKNERVEVEEAPWEMEVAIWKASRLMTMEKMEFMVLMGGHLHFQ